MPIQKITSGVIESSQTLTTPTITSPTISGNTNFDSGTLFVDATNNRVGVGTSNPSRPLDVLGSARLSFSGGDNYVEFESASNYVGRNSAGNLAINVSGGQNIISSIGGSEAMRIDPSGRVTTPLQPSFVASRSAAYTYTDASVLVYDTASKNIGGSYNTSNGLFTAPVAGVYSFMVSVWGSTPISQIWWVINSARGVSVSVSGDSILIGSAIVYLNANDTIGFAAFANTPTFTINASALHSYFAGILIG
jgi:hypothetical protein